jgi:hypothetical protein
MPLRFQRRINLARGVRMNLSKSGISVSLGKRGAQLTIGPRGPRATVGLPGTGLGFTTTKRRSPLPWIIGAIALAAFVIHFAR